jgi:hypothetical protein
MRLLPPCLTRTLLPLPVRHLPRPTPRNHIPRRILTTSTSSRAPIDVPKLYVAPGSPHHNSLPTFVEYADRTRLNKLSTVYVGTHYEYIVSQSLLRLGFSLFRTGGRADRGIDLLGHWVLPTLREPLPVVVQCKSVEGRCCNPAHVRELEGAFLGTPVEWRNKDVLGLLVTTQNATKGVLERLGMSKWPLGFMKVSRKGTVEQCLWNEAAQARGLEGVGVTVRYTPLVLLKGKNDVEDEEADALPDIINGKRRRRKRVPEKFRMAGAKKDIQLTWMGSPIFPEREGLDDETMKLLDVLAHDSQEWPKGKKRTGGWKGRPGRPLGAKNKPKVATASTVVVKEPETPATPSPSPPAKRKPGRPPGALNKHKSAASTRAKKTVHGRIGRPPGSKNKVKPSSATDEDG